MAAITEGTPYFNAYQTAAINGMVVHRTGNKTLTVDTGTCRDSTDTCNIILTGSTTYGNQYVSSYVTGVNNITNNAANNGVNGLDTGSIAASTLYAVYVIANSISDQRYPTATLTSTSLTAPTLPQGYDIFRLIGFLSTDGSSNYLPGNWYGASNLRTWQYDSIQQVVSNFSSQAYQAIFLSNLVPAISNLPVILNTFFTPNSAGTTATFRQSGGTGTTGYSVSGVVVSQPQDSVFTALAGISNALPAIDAKVANTADKLTVDVLGYQFNF